MTTDFSTVTSVDQARLQALAKSWPAVCIATVGVVAASVTVNIGYAPWWVLAIAPLFLLPKALFWPAMMRIRNGGAVSSRVCARMLRLLSAEVLVWGSTVVAWQVWLIEWATPQATLLLSLCLGGEMVFFLFGMLHLRIASTIAASFCVLGMTYLSAGAGPDMLGIVILLGGGLLGLAYFAYETARDFSDLVMSRLRLETKNAEVQSLSEQNYRIANTDMLTEIGNRRSCFRDLEAALGKAEAEGSVLSFGIIDLDGFKTVNDSNGHLVGDRLLAAMAQRLKETLAVHGDVYRLGGDEFAFILPGEDDAERLVAVGNAVIESVNTPIHVGELRLLLGCSVGFASFPRSAANATEIYDRADYALFNAKRTGRLKPVVFSEEHERDVRQTALIERTLRAADLEAELFLTFQPIVDSHEDTTPLLECLARWQSPVLGFVSPGSFIVVAEQCGFISNLTPVLLRKALDAVKQWPEEIGISFNLSGHDIVSPEKVLNLIGILGRSGVSPGRIEFEVTETALMMNLDQALANIHLLKATGARISLDDFGTGYSSLSQIQKLPLDKIKVDGSFVRDIADSEASRKIVRSVTALSRDLSLKCVVEGVETREQLDILQGIGCSLIQGYFYSKPMREHEVAAFLSNQMTARDIAAEEAAEARAATA